MEKDITQYSPQAASMNHAGLTKSAEAGIMLLRGGDRGDGLGATQIRTGVSFRFLRGWR